MPAVQEFARTFRSMNTDVIAIVNAGLHRQAEVEQALAEVQALFEECEDVMSRFRPGSELSWLNRSSGQPFVASPLLFQVVSDAISWSYATGGVFDPTVLRAIVDAGYDRSFEELPTVPVGESSSTGRERNATIRGNRLSERPWQTAGSGGHTTLSVSAWTRIRLDRSTRTITMPPEVGIDLGGIGKGWAVDRAVDRLRAFDNFAVDAGGDLYVGGTLSDGGPWTVGVQDPFFLEHDMLTLVARDRAVATSTTMRRRWALNGEPQHHLIDPRTGHPSASGVASVTVLAESVASAEVVAKVALLMGPEAGQRFLERRSVDWVMVTVEGMLKRSPGIEGALYEP
ncbi:MAG TPA: FAD:protein FMN transferase [Chloroflexota bacterium]|nr:FAD:protein FMN transferase [Chloroflexota bacterium]